PRWYTQCFADESTQFEWRFSNAAWLVLLLGYMGVTRMCIDLLNCVPIGGRTVLAIAPYIQCWKGDHTRYAVSGIVIISLVGLGVPVFIFLFLRQLLNRVIPSL